MKIAKNTKPIIAKATFDDLSLIRLEFDDWITLKGVRLSQKERKPIFINLNSHNTGMHCRLTLNSSQLVPASARSSRHTF